VRNYPARLFKFPPGFFAGERIVSNNDYARVYPKAAAPRQGTVIAATAKRGVLRILWDKTRSDQPVEIKFLMKMDDANG